MALTGICGDDCSYCPRYLATQKNNIRVLEEVKELWVRFGLRTPNFPIEKMSCHGCQPENECAYSELRNCIHSKGVRNCGFCNQYPCEIIEAVFATSEKFKLQARQICNQAEMALLNKAFFSKREYFDQIRRNQEK